MLIREATSWPPQYGGAQQSGRDIPKFGNGLLYSVYPENNCLITFAGEFDNQGGRWHLKAGSAELAEKITETLRQNVGKALAMLGDLEVSAASAPRIIARGETGCQTED